MLLSVLSSSSNATCVLHNYNLTYPPSMTNPRKVITVNIIKTSLSSPSSIISSILYGCNTIQDHFLGQLYIGLTTSLARPSTDQYILLGQ